MSELTIDDLIAILDDMLTKRLAALQATAFGQSYEPMIRRRLGELRALPEALRSRPLSELLATTDQRFDALGAAIDEIGRGLERLWDLLSPETLASVKAIRARFVPARAVLKAMYADEAAHARKVKPSLTEHEAALRAIPLPEGHTMYDVASRFVDSGEQIGTLLSRRVEQETDAQRNEAGKLRSRTLKLLTRLRDAVDEALDHDPALPRDLDARLFGFLDQRVAQRAASAAATTPVAGGEPAPEPTTVS